MGLASYKENIDEIQNMLRHDLLAPAAEWAQQEESAGKHDVAARVREAIRVAEQLLQHVRRERDALEELATDPSITLADQIQNLRWQMRAIESERDMYMHRAQNIRAQMHNYVEQMKLDYDTNKRVQIGELQQALNDCKKSLREARQDAKNKPNRRGGGGK